VIGGELPECGSLNLPGCPDGYACVDDPNDDCAGGPAVDCPGFCRPRADGECAVDSDCPQLEAACAICADGTVSCPVSRCDAGKCMAERGTCGVAVCGGISGKTCDPGFVCLEDPTDDCDPADGAADCGGICVPDVRPPGCGDPATGETCAPGFECVDDPNDMCEPDATGVSCPLSCQPVDDTGECATDADCPPILVPCPICADGNTACPRSFCANGKCAIERSSCPMPPGCTDDAACPSGEICARANCDPAVDSAECQGVCTPSNPPPRACGGFAGDTCPPGYVCVDDRSDDCKADSGADCPGVCELAPPPTCTSDEECAVMERCAICPDGSYSCPRGECVNGACGISFGACSAPAMCAGIAGFACPPGFTCIDDPADDCDPNNGGADCGGLCVREEGPRRCGGIAGEACPPGYECAFESSDGCDPATGADCQGVCKPAMSGGCSSDADCPVIGAPCELCADGTAACPRSFCEDGVCQAKFEVCGGER
jgi:hypothetical protein